MYLNTGLVILGNIGGGGGGLGGGGLVQVQLHSPVLVLVFSLDSGDFGFPGHFTWW